MKEDAPPPTRRPWNGLAWLIAAAVFLLVSNGRWQIALAAWLAPLCLRAFLMSQPLVRGLSAGFAIQLVAYVAHWTEIIPVPGVLYFVIAATYALVYFVPFVVDRLVAPRLPVLASTLVLPSTWFLAECLVERLAPYGSWAALGYTQMDQLLLVQLAAVTGVAGIGFAVIWTAAVFASVFVSGARGRPRLVLTWAAAAVVVLMLGGLRLARTPHAVEQTRVALLTPSIEQTAEFEQTLLPFRSGSTDETLVAPVLASARRINEDLLERSRREARAGARLVVWSEHAGRALKEEEGYWIDQGRALAREESIHLFMSLGTWRRHETPPFENKVVVITPDGEVAWEQQKARPIVGAESGFILARHDALPVLDSPLGRLAVVVCHDLDFPDYIRQAGRQKVDVLLAPAADWSAIATLHADMARARAVENGLVLVRPTYAGRSIVVDPFGRLVSAAYDSGLEGRALISPMPMMRVASPYPLVGGLLIWLDLAALATLMILALRNRPPAQRTLASEETTSAARPSLDRYAS